MMTIVQLKKYHPNNHDNQQHNEIQDYLLKYPILIDLKNEKENPLLILLLLM